MGFNINRISHQRHEPSSWSPSRGAMFFRDAENFANAYFAVLPATIENVSFDRKGDLANVSIGVKSRSAKQETLTLEVRSGSKGLVALPASTLTMAPGATVSTAVSVGSAEAGTQFVEVRLVAADGAVIDRARYACAIPAPVAITVTKTILFEGETDFPVTLKVSPPAGGADEMRYSVMSAGKVVAQASGPMPTDGSAILPFAVSALGAGQYEFRAELVKSGKAVGAASQSFRIMPDPWSAKLSGSAGTGAPSSGVPAGFSALATTMPDGQAPRGFEGEIPYLDAATKERGFLMYGVTATSDMASGGRGRRRRSAAPTDAFPRKAELDAPMRAFAAGDEYEAVSFVVFALEDLKNPRVTFTELKNSTGAVIPPGLMDLRAERTDTYLVKQESLGDMPKNTARRYFLTVYVAPGTPAGDYRGKVIFSADGGKSGEREYSLLVLPFALPLPPMANGIYGRMHGAADTERDMMVAADLLAHGMDNPTCVNVLKATRMFNVHHLIWDLEIAAPEYWLGDGPARFNTPIDETILANMKKTGLRGPFVIEVNYLLRYLPCTEENAELFAKTITRIEEARKKYGLDEFAYHLVDEPNNHYTYDDGRFGRRYGIERARFFGKVMKKLGLRTYVSMNSAGRGYDIGEYVYDELDIWCANFISDEKQIDRWTVGGREVWLYNYAGDGWCKGAARSTYGFYAFRARAAGVTIWHHPGYVGWNETEKKVVARAAWDAIREGIDDSRYVAELKSLMDKARKAGGDKARLADAAERDLNAIISAYPVPTHEKVAFEALHDASDWTKWRWIVADWILKLM